MGILIHGSKTKNLHSWYCKFVVSPADPANCKSIHKAKNDVQIIASLICN